jgi:hypothetical protein
MGANKPQKVYTLDDGQAITPNELAKELQMSVPAARCRLEKYSDKKAVFRVVGASRPKRTYKCKEYILSDGSRQTARQVSKKFDVSLCTCRNRLSNGITDINRLSKQPNANKQHNIGKRKVEELLEVDLQKGVTKRMYNRNYFCPLSRLLLKII